jgi:cell division septum initiation protein DivIVA
MPDRELKKLSRSELLELLVKLSEENEALMAEKAALQTQLEDKALHLQQAGSIAEAALKVNGIFEDAQRAAEQYLENIRRLNDSAQAQADALLAKTQEKCDEMLAEAKAGSDAQWDTLQARLDAYCAAHEGLKEQLGSLLIPQR